MSLKKLIDASVKDHISIEEHVEESDLCKLPDSSREFEYKLNDKATKAKLVKNAKRIPLEIEDNTSSSNLKFSVGA